MTDSVIAIPIVPVIIVTPLGGDLLDIRSGIIDPGRGNLLLGGSRLRIERTLPFSPPT